MKSSVTIAMLLGVALLVGCSPAQPADDDTPASSSPTTSTPVTPSSGEDDDDDPVDPDILFTISVTSTAPNGAIADLVMTVFKPVAATEQQAADEAALDGECDGWRATFPAPAYVVAQIDVTDTSPSGSSWDRSPAVASMNGWPAFSGEVDTFMAYCASDQVNLGSSRAVTPVLAASGADGQHGWAHIEYGFGISTEAGSDVPGPNDAVLSDCQITLSAEAAASAIASAWTPDGDPLGCMFGEYDY